MSASDDLTAATALARLAAGEDLQGRRIVGPLRIQGLGLRSLPDGFNVWGPLEISGCPELELLPRGLKVSGNLRLLHCPKLRGLPRGLVAPFSLQIVDCPSLTRLPVELKAEALDVSKQRPMHYGARSYVGAVVGPALRVLSIGEGSTFETLGFAQDLDELPEHLTILRDLDLTRCEKLRTLPEDLTVKGTLTAPRGLQSMGPTHAGSLVLTGVTALQSLRDLRVAGDLIVADCGAIELVERVHCKGNVELRSLSALKEVRGLRAGGTLVLRSCPALRRATELACMGDPVLDDVPALNVPALNVPALNDQP